jgi:hypothetical protein
VTGRTASAGVMAGTARRRRWDVMAVVFMVVVVLVVVLMVVLLGGRLVVVEIVTLVVPARPDKKQTVYWFPVNKDYFEGNISTYITAHKILGDYTNFRTIRGSRPVLVLSNRYR